jgi:hypothetical protein
MQSNASMPSPYLLQKQKTTRWKWQVVSVLSSYRIDALRRLGFGDRHIPAMRLLHNMNNACGMVQHL